MNNNIPIEQLLKEYAEEGCDFEDMEWLVNAAHRYVSTMADSQLRCILYALATEAAVWNRVENGIPENDKSVLTWDGHTTCIDRWTDDESENLNMERIVNAIGDDNGPTEFKVTHWQYIPKRPKSG